MQHAIEAKAMTLHTPIKARLEDDRRNRQAGDQVIGQTTPGRMLLSEVLPRHPNLPFSIINRLLTKKEITNVIDAVYRHCGQKETVIFADRMMGMGLAQACKAGISFGKDDLDHPGSEEQAGRRCAAEGQRIRAAVPGRPDHPGREVQQGGRRLVELHRAGRRRDDESDVQGTRPATTSTRCT